MKWRRLYSDTVDKDAGVLADQTIMLNGKKSHVRYPDKMRRIKYRDKETNITYFFLTNDFNSTCTSYCSFI